MRINPFVLVQAGVTTSFDIFYSFYLGLYALNERDKLILSNLMFSSVSQTIKNKEKEGILKMKLLLEHRRLGCVCWGVEFKYKQSFSRINVPPLRLFSLTHYLQKHLFQGVSLLLR